MAENNKLYRVTIPEAGGPDKNLWDQAKLDRNYDKLMSKYPDAKVEEATPTGHKVRVRSKNYEADWDNDRYNNNFENLKAKYPDAEDEITYSYSPYSRENMQKTEPIPVENEKNSQIPQESASNQPETQPQSAQKNPTTPVEPKPEAAVSQQPKEPEKPAKDPYVPSGYERKDFSLGKVDGKTFGAGEYYGDQQKAELDKEIQEKAKANDEAKRKEVERKVAESQAKYESQQHGYNGPVVDSEDEMESRQQYEKVKEYTAKTEEDIKSFGEELDSTSAKMDELSKAYEEKNTALEKIVNKYRTINPDGSENVGAMQPEDYNTAMQLQNEIQEIASQLKDLDSKYNETAEKYKISLAEYENNPIVIASSKRERLAEIKKEIKELRKQLPTIGVLPENAQEISDKLNALRAERRQILSDLRKNRYNVLADADFSDGISGKIKDLSNLRASLGIKYEPIYGSGYAYVAPDDIAQKEEYKIEAAERIYKAAQSTISAPIKGEGGFFKGVVGRALDPDFFTMGLSGIADNKAVIDAYAKINNGEELTESEQAVVDAYQTYSIASALRANDTSNLYKGGQGAIDMAMLTLEMSATAALGGAALSKAMKNFLMKSMKPMMGKIAARAVAGGAVNGTRRAAEFAGKEAAEWIISDIAGLGQTAVFVAATPNALKTSTQLALPDPETGQMKPLKDAVKEGFFHEVMMQQFLQSPQKLLRAFKDTRRIAGYAKKSDSINKWYRDFVKNSQRAGTNASSNVFWATSLASPYAFVKSAAFDQLNSNFDSIPGGDEDALANFFDGDNLAPLLISLIPGQIKGIIKQAGNKMNWEKEKAMFGDRLNRRDENLRRACDQIFNDGGQVGAILSDAIKSSDFKLFVDGQTDNPNVQRAKELAPQLQKAYEALRRAEAEFSNAVKSNVQEDVEAANAKLNEAKKRYESIDSEYCDAILNGTLLDNLANSCKGNEQLQGALRGLMSRSKGLSRKDAVKLFESVYYMMEATNAYHTFDGEYQGVQEGLRAEKQRQILEELGAPEGAKFWSEETQGRLTRKVVTIARLNDGREVFVLSTEPNSNGEYPIAEKGKGLGFIRREDIEGIIDPSSNNKGAAFEQMTLNEYLERRLIEDGDMQRMYPTVYEKPAEDREAEAREQMMSERDADARKTKAVDDTNIILETLASEDKLPIKGISEAHVKEGSYNEETGDVTVVCKGPDGQYVEFDTTIDKLIDTVAPKQKAAAEATPAPSEPTAEQGTVSSTSGSSYDQNYIENLKAEYSQKVGDTVEYGGDPEATIARVVSDGIIIDHNGGSTKLSWAELADRRYPDGRIADFPLVAPESAEEAAPTEGELPAEMPALTGNEDTSSLTDGVAPAVQEPQPEPAAEPEAPAVELPRLDDGSIDFDKLIDTNPEEFYYQYSQIVGRDDAKRGLTDRISELQKKYDKSKSFNEKATLKKKIDEIKAVVNKINSPKSGDAPSAIAEPGAAPQGSSAAEKPADEELGEDFNIIPERFNASTRIKGNKKTYYTPSGKKLKGHYEIVEADAITPSHDPNNGYEPSKGFPKSGGQVANSRDYTKPATRNVTEQMAGNYNGKAIQDTPIVSMDGVVMSGNGRTIASQIAAKNGTDTQYIADLKEQIEDFGFDADALEGFKHPRLALVLDEPISYDVATFDEFNGSDQKRETKSEKANKFGRILNLDKNRDLATNIASTISEFDTMSEFVSNPKAVNEVFKLLVDAGVISNLDKPELINQKDGTATPEFKTLLENAFLGMVLDKQAIESIVDASGMGDYGTKVAMAMVPLVENSKYEKYNISNELSDAVKLILTSKRAASGEAKGKGETDFKFVIDYLSQPSIELGGRFPEVSTEAQAIAMALCEYGPKKFKEFIERFNQNVANFEYGESMFGDEQAPTKEGVLTQILKNDEQEFKPINYNEEPAEQGGDAPEDAGGNGTELPADSQKPGEPANAAKGEGEGEGEGSVKAAEQGKGGTEAPAEKKPVEPAGESKTAEKKEPAKSPLETAAETVAEADKKKAGTKPENKEPKDRELTEEEIRNSGYEDEDEIESAVDFINGDTSFAARLAYKTIKDYVLLRESPGGQNNADANKAQLAEGNMGDGTGAEGNGRGESSEMGEGPVEESVGSVGGNEVPPVSAGSRGGSGTGGEGANLRTPGNNGTGRRSGNTESGRERVPDGRGEGGNNGADVKNKDRGIEAGSQDVSGLEDELNNLLQDFEVEPMRRVDVQNTSIPNGHKLIFNDTEPAAPAKNKSRDAAPLSSKSEPIIPEEIDLATLSEDKAIKLNKIFFTAAKLGYAFATSKEQYAISDFRRFFKEKFEGVISEKLGFTKPQIEGLFNSILETKLKINGERLSLEDYLYRFAEQEAKAENDKSRELKAEAQTKVNGAKGIEPANRKQIKEQLPILAAGQWDDVAFTERQFFGESHKDYDHAFGKGALVTNGTGTGKTFSGMGVIKRFSNAGKGRIIIVCPAPMKDDWIKTAKKFDIDIHELESMKDKGEGVVITSYQNFAGNHEIMKDAFDLVVYDECQNILENQQGSETQAFAAHKKLTNRDIESAMDRLVHKTPEGIERDRIQDELDKATKKTKDRKLSDAERLLYEFRVRELTAELNDAEAQVNLIRPSLKEEAEKDVEKTKVLLLSATPFNSVNNLAIASGICFNYPPVFKSDGTEIKKEDARKAQFMGEWFSGTSKEQDEIDFGNHLIHELETACYRQLDNGYDYSRDFPDVSGDMIMTSRFNSAWNDLASGPLSDTAISILENPLWSSLLFETMKCSAMRKRFDEHLAAGRKLVIFHKRMHVSDASSVQNLPPVGPPFAAVLDKAQENADARQMVAIAEFRNKYADLLKWEQTLDYRPVPEQINDFYATAADRAKYDKEMLEYNTKTLVDYKKKCDRIIAEHPGASQEQLLALLPKVPKAPRLHASMVCEFNGEMTEKEKIKSKSEFNDDNSEKKIICVTDKSGGAGLSLHDTTGKHQRVSENLILPYSPIGFIQIEGRTYRYGNKSNAIFEYPRLGINLEAIVFATQFNAKAETVENLAHGDEGRGLKDSISTGFYESSGLIPIESQGVGTKKLDVRGSGLKGLEKAIHDYAVAQRKGIRSSDKSIPEPLGYIVAKLGGLDSGDEAYIPFAGRGSIARYMNKGVITTAFESNQDLTADLALTAGGKDLKIENESFFDKLAINKTDVVLFGGYAGEDGSPIEAATKALEHLNEGGRLVAVVDTSTNTKDITLDKKGFVERMSISLPANMAGKGDKKILIIDKISNQELAKKASNTALDYSMSPSLDALANALDSIKIPDRIIDKRFIAIKKLKSIKSELSNNPFINITVMKPESSTLVQFYYPGKRGYAKSKIDWSSIRLIGTWSYYSPRIEYSSIDIYDIQNLSTDSRIIQNYITISELLEEDDAEFRSKLNLPSDAKIEDVAEIRKLFKGYQKIIKAVTGYEDSQIKRISNGLKPEISASDISDMVNLEVVKEKFEMLNKNEDMGELFDLVYSKMKNTGIVVKNQGTPAGSFANFAPGEKALNFDPKKWNIADDDKRGPSLLHEMIHAVTSYALDYKDYSFNAPESIEKDVEWINNIFIATTKQGLPEDISKVAGGDVGYSIQNLHEFCANITKPIVMEALKERPLWLFESNGRMRVSGKEIEGAEKTTAYKVLLDAVTKLINDFDKDLLDEYLQYASTFGHRDIDGNPANIEVKRSDDAELLYSRIGDIRNTEEDAVFDSSSRDEKIAAIKNDANAYNVNVNVYTDVKDLPKGVKKDARGWYDPKTGIVNVVLPNCKNVDVVADVMLHEAAGHKGLRTLFGEDFETAMKNVYESAEDSIKAEIDKMVNSGRVKDTIEGTEEYISRLGERGPITESEQRWWEKIRSWLVNILRKAGIKIRKLTDQDLRALFFESQRAQKNAASPIETARDRVKIMDYKEAAYRSHEEEESNGNGGGPGNEGENRRIYNMRSDLAGYPTIELDAKEYGKFKSIVRSEHNANFKGRLFCTIAIDNTQYGFINNGFDNYRIIFVGDISNFTRGQKLKLDDLNAKGFFNNVDDVREYVASFGRDEIRPDDGSYDGGEGRGQVSPDKMDGGNNAVYRRGVDGMYEGSLRELEKERDAEYLDAVKSGDITKAQRMVDEKADAILNSILLPDDSGETGFKYHRGEAPKKTRTMYAVFNVNPDGFHAAYAGNKTPTPVGVWLDAQNLKSYESSTTFFDDGTPATYIPGDTGKSTKIAGIDPASRGPEAIGKSWLLERGGKHGSDVPNFSQMNLGVNENGEKVNSPIINGALPHNKLVFEIECGMLEDGDLTDFVKEHGRMMKGKNQGLKNVQPNQFYFFKTNPNAKGNWGIAGTFRIKRLVPIEEIEEVSKKAGVPVQKWVGGYHPEDVGLSVEMVDKMYKEGLKRKLTDAVTYDDNGKIIPLSERFDDSKEDVRYSLTSDEAIEQNIPVGDISEIWNYEKDVNNWVNRIIESNFDAHNPVRILVDNIAKKTGKPLEKGEENPADALDKVPSKFQYEKEEVFRPKFLKPLLETRAKIIKDTNLSTEDIDRYMDLKSGLEVQTVYAKRDARKSLEAKKAAAIAALDKEASDYEDRLAETEEYYNTEIERVNRGDETQEDYAEFRKKEYGAIRIWFAEYKDNNGAWSSEKPARLPGEIESQYNSRIHNNMRFVDNNMPDAEERAQKEIERYEGIIGDELVNELWERTKAVTDYNEKLKFEHGLSTKKHMEDLIGNGEDKAPMRQFYVPLRGFDEDTASDLYDYINTGVAPSGKSETAFAKEAVGRITKPGSPFQHIGAMHDAYAHAAFMNDAFNALYEIINNRGIDQKLATISKMWYVRETDEYGNERWVPSYPDIPEEATTEEVASIVKEWSAKMRELQKDGDATQNKATLDLHGAVVYIDKSRQIPQHVIRGRRAGREYMIIVNSSPRAVASFMGKNKNLKARGEFMGMYGKFLRTWSALNTSARFAFGLGTNLQRDIESAVVYSGVMMPKDFRKEFAKNLAKSIIEMPFLYYGNNAKGLAEDRKLFELYKKEGGPTGFAYIQNCNEYDKYLYRQLESDTNAIPEVMQKAKMIGRTAIGIIEAMEQVSRFAAFKAGIKTGMSVADAATIAKEITVNFNKRGSLERVSFADAGNAYTKSGVRLSSNEGSFGERAGRTTARILLTSLSEIQSIASAVVPFLGAKSGGIYRFLKMWGKDSRSKMVAANTIEFALGFIHRMLATALPFMTAAFLGGDDDDENQNNIIEGIQKNAERYNRMSYYKRHNKQILGLPGTDIYATWAVPQEMVPFRGAGDMIAGALLGEETWNKVGSTILKESSGEFLPVNFNTVRHEIFGVSTALDLIFNEDYKGSKITSTNQWNESLPQYRQGTNYTWDFMVGLSKGLSDLTGGGESRPGWIDWNPAVMQHLVTSFGGGITQDLLTVANTIDKAFSSDKEISLRDFPIANRYVSQYSDSYIDGRISSYYKYFKGLAKAGKAQSKDANETGDKKARTSIDTKYANVFNANDKKIKSDWDRINRLQEKKAPTSEIKEAYRILNEDMGKVVRKCFEIYSGNGKD